MSGFAGVAADLELPPLAHGPPRPGARVRIVAGSATAVLWLPPTWATVARRPLLVEFPGNGPFVDARGNASSGLVEDARLGFGLAHALGAASLVLPIVGHDGLHASMWWGDPEATTAACRRSVRRLIDEHGVDAARIALVGFSRGSIACSYLGLRDDATAALWRAFICASHCDGARQWGQPEDDRAAALARLARLRGRPVFACHERPDGVAATRAVLAEAGARATCIDLPWEDHTDRWTLHDVEPRRLLRTWLADALA